MRRIILTRLGLGMFGLAVAVTPALADCVVGASMATRFQVLDGDTLILFGGSKILLKIFCCVSSSSSVSVLKDSFCDYDDSVLFIDGEPVDVQAVRRLD